MVAQIAAIAMMGLTDRICDITLPGWYRSPVRAGLRRSAFWPTRPVLQI
jgi:hypothetical protein